MEPRSHSSATSRVSGAGHDEVKDHSGELQFSSQSSTHTAQFTLYLCCPQSVVTSLQLGLHFRGRGAAGAARRPQTSGDLGTRPLGASTKPTQPWELLSQHRRTGSSTTHTWSSPPPQALVSTVPRGLGHSQARLSGRGHRAVTSCWLASALPPARTVPVAEAAQSAPPRRP